MTTITSVRNNVMAISLSFATKFLQTSYTCSLSRAWTCSHIRGQGHSDYNFVCAIQCHGYITFICDEIPSYFIHPFISLDMLAYHWPGVKGQGHSDYNLSVHNNTTCAREFVLSAMLLLSILIVLLMRCFQIHMLLLYVGNGHRCMEYHVTGAALIAFVSSETIKPLITRMWHV